MDTSIKEKKHPPSVAGGFRHVSYLLLLLRQ